MYPFLNSGYGRARGLIPPASGESAPLPHFQMQGDGFIAQQPMQSCKNQAYHRWLSAPSAMNEMMPPPNMMQVFNPNNRYNALWMFLDLECTSLDHSSPDFGILEIAATVVDDCMTVMDTFHVIVNQPPNVILNASKWCKAKFCSRSEGGNDLFAQCELSSITQADAGNMLEGFILKHAKKRHSTNHESASEAEKRSLFRSAEFDSIDTVIADVETPEEKRDRGGMRDGSHSNAGGMEHYRIMLAGCSVYFDRSALLHNFPQLRKLIGHKTIELSSLLEIGRRWRPDILRSLPPTQECHRALVDVMESVALLKWFWRSFLVGC
jgi:oligoribonuclease (3'-5' exoribonuclease)